MAYVWQDERGWELRVVELADNQVTSYRAEGAAPVRSLVIAMIVMGCALTTLGVIRVSRQHEVLRLGYQLEREAEHVRRLREVRRRLEVEYATLTAPERI